MLPVEIIRHKRDRGRLSREEIRFIVEDYSADRVPDYQMSAWLMAVWLNGMDAGETLDLTQAMLDSGEKMDFSTIPLPKVDKHSTGGVGDKTSLILGPIAAACGLAVPMISGRGLGHSGGTLDKLESIPGFNTKLDEAGFRKMVETHHLCFMGQTEKICPADRKIYSLRDVTGTVESIPLICASIMSKKLAEGIDALVLDVKYGNGAFMKTKEKARDLAQALMNIGRRAGKKMSALITNMEQPLGRYVGNALEVEECLAVLKGAYKPFEDTRELSLQLASHMLFLGGKALSLEEAYGQAEQSLRTGAAFKKLEAVCKAQGGRLNELPKPKKQHAVLASQDGFLASYKTEQIGFTAIELGAGRRIISDPIDPTAGMEVHKKIGDSVKKGDVLFTLFAQTETSFTKAEERLLPATIITPDRPQIPPLIADTLLD